MWDIALSTMWGVGRFDQLKDFFQSAQQLGVQRFELNHQVNSHMLNGLQDQPVRVVSVHEPCPADVSTATLKEKNWLISSRDPDGRAQGVLAVKRSIDLAVELGVRVIVVHPGRVDVDAALEDKLWRLFETAQAGTPEYVEAKEHLSAARAARADANLEAVRRSLLELAEYAGRVGVRLALENRYHYLDIPLAGELDTLLDLVDDERIGFCYDVGHAQTLENLGFERHEEWPRRWAHRILEVHLHDIQGLRDHYATGLGEIDWEMVASYVPAGAIRTLEFRNDNTPQQIAKALEFLEDRGLVKRLETPGDQRPGTGKGEY